MCGSRYSSESFARSASSNFCRFRARYRSRALWMVSSLFRFATMRLRFSCSSRCFSSCSATLSFFAHLTRPDCSTSEIRRTRGRTSGRTLGRYQRLKIFSGMKSPWYARVKAFDCHRCEKSETVVRFHWAFLASSPNERRYRLYRFCGDQLCVVKILIRLLEGQMNS